MRLLRCYSRFFPVIPAKAGIQTADAAALWERGRPAGGAALTRVTLTLALSHKWRGDPPVGIRAWFRMAGLDAILWIPAFAGMTGEKAGMTG